MSARPHAKRKTMNGAGSPNCRPGSVQLHLSNMKRQLNYFLRQGDEEVNKRTKQKKCIYNK